MAPSQTIRSRKKLKRGRPVTVRAEKRISARLPSDLVKLIDEVGNEQGARGRSEALRKALELLRELRGKQ